MSDDDDPLLRAERLLDSLDPFGSNEPGRSRYYDREGNPLKLRECARLFDDETYQRVCQDRLDEGNVWVSTVWLGLDHNFFRAGPPLIFETMVFVRSTEEQVRERAARWMLKGFSPYDFPWEDLQCQRWATEDEARDGHRAIVDSLRMRMDLLLDITEDES